MPLFHRQINARDPLPFSSSARPPARIIYMVFMPFIKNVSRIERAAAKLYEWNMMRSAAAIRPEIATVPL